MSHNIMNEELNKINNKHFIKISKQWNFVYLEENIEIDSPTKDYYFKYNDLSINLHREKAGQ